MTLYRNAFYGFVALLIILVLGFWHSYFSRLTEPMHITLHFHSIAMLAWVLLLITQSWLIRRRKLPRHRALGKLSFVIAPAVVISGAWVNLHFQSRVDEPLAPFIQGIFWFAFFLAMLFALQYTLAIRYRKNMQLHARYMASTALVFLVPGLGRALNNFLGPLGIWTPSFYQVTYIPLLIGIWLMVNDWRKDQAYQPWLVFNLAWCVNLLLWSVLPRWGAWNAFAQWAGDLSI